jgi:GntR family transcriptional regulator / MocR family aminotransferase
MDLWPLSLHYIQPDSRSALLLGYAGMTPDDIRTGVTNLAAILRLVSRGKTARLR